VYTIRVGVVRLDSLTKEILESAVIRIWTPIACAALGVYNDVAIAVSEFSQLGVSIFLVAAHSRAVRVKNDAAAATFAAVRDGE
jgi:hypothetical protein